MLNWVEAAIREGWYWQADANTNTLLGILNSDTEAATVRMSLDYYVQGSRHSYELPDLSIPPQSSTMVDIGEVVANGTPDADGDVIPADVNFGGYRVRKTGPRPGNITTEALLLDRRQKGFLSVYNTGCCYEWPATLPSSFAGTPGIGSQLAVRSFESCTGAGVNFVTEPLINVHVLLASDDTAIADITPEGDFTLIEPGSTTLHSTTLFPFSGQLCRRNTANGSCSVTVHPSVSFGSFSFVGKNNTATVQVTLTPASSSVPVTLTLAPASGSGAAQFMQNNSGTLSITDSQSVEIRGITESSTANNMRLQAKVGSTLLATRTFTVVHVLLSLRPVGTVSPDNAGLVTYQATLGTSSLGTYFNSSGSGNHLWRTGVEIVGTVFPSNFTGSMILEREVLQSYLYADTALIDISGPFGDTTPDPSLRDDNPQSGGSGGKVYDLDAPGLGTGGSPVGTILRRRLNFKQWAAIGGVKVSDDLFWFSRTSIIKTSTGDALQSSVGGDNLAGTGTTPLTWNLQ